MLALGLCDGHDAGACLARDGGIVAAVSEERLTRRKRQAGFPYQSIQCCLELAGVSASAIHQIAVAERSGRSLHRLVDYFYRRTDPNRLMNRRSNRASSALQNFLARQARWSDRDAAFSKNILEKRLAEIGLRAPLVLVDHHLAHTMSAAKGSGFAEALVITMDAFGDGISGTVSHWKDGRLEMLERIPYPHSPALLYGLVNAELGYGEGEEGKVTAMAAQSDSTAAKGLFESLFTSNQGSFRMARFTPAWLKRAVSQFAPADIAAGLQLCIQDLLSALVGYWMKKTGARNLSLAGGLFANVRLNQVVAEANGCMDLYVFPHMGDGGLCVGAALAASDDPTPTGQFIPVVGPAPDCSTIDGLSTASLINRPLDEAAIKAMAGRLAEGWAIGIVNGPMEFGPRALGHRSILFSAQHPELARRISDALERSLLMPYAPVVREEDLKLFTSARAWKAFSCMTATADALPGIADRFPTAVHVDGTMRIQTVSRKNDPLLHDILTAYGEWVSPPLLINTSFNRHKEPIVADVSQAMDLFIKSPLAGLVAGQRYLEKRGVAEK